MMVSLHRRGSPSLVVLLLVTAVGFGVITSLAIVSEVQDPPPVRVAPVADRRVEAIEKYVDSILPAVESAGSAIVRGIRPDIVDFKAGVISAAVWKEDMQARAREFRDAARLLAQVSPPEGLGEVSDTFGRAFREYQLAVRTLFEAGSSEGEKRLALISLGATVGDVADAMFDVGAAQIQRERRDLGIGPDLRIPDPTGGLQRLGAGSGQTGALGVTAPCISPGDVQGLIVRGPPKALVTFNTIYADHAAEPLSDNGENGSGVAEVGGTGMLRVNWQVPSAAGQGTAMVTVAITGSPHPTIREIRFAVGRDACRSR